MKRVLRSLAHLRVLVLWWAADDQMLNIVGETCHFLEALDVWRSVAVTDLGIKMLLSAENEDNAGCHQTLMRLGVKETSCTHLGCMAAILRCRKLEVLNFSHTTVVKEFFSEIRSLDKDERTYSLKSLFLPVTNGTDFRQVIKAFPELEDLRLWTSVPQLRDIDVMASDLPKLQSLLLGGLHSSRILSDLVQSIGSQLTTLKVETVLTVIPLQIIGRNCPGLVELQIINGRVAIRDHLCEAESFFSELKLLYLFLVQYVMIDDDEENNTASEDEGAPISALHCLLRHARGLEAFQATGCADFDDDSLKYAMMTNPLSRLRRFIMTDTALQQDPTGTSLTLTSSSVLRLFEACPNLQCVGDLRHWNISPAERRRIAKQIQCKTGVKWISTASH